MKSRSSRRAYFIIIVLLILAIFDLVNISDIISVPFNNINFELWNIVIVVVLYILTYVIVDKRNNKRKRNQEEFARELLEQTYKLCDEYEKLFDSTLFKDICPKRFPGNQTMENNTVYNNLKEAPFEYDSVIFSLGQEGVISISEIQNYIAVKSKYNTYFTQVICFPDVDEITDPLKYELESEIEKAISQLKK